MGVVIWKGLFPSSVAVAGVPKISPVAKSEELLRHRFGVFVAYALEFRIASDVVKAFRNWLLGKYPQLCLIDEAKTDRITIVVNLMILLTDV